jgi:hypothetical protein
VEHCTRRKFLSKTAGGAILAAAPALAQSRTLVNTTLSIEEQTTLSTVPQNFTGLSYESAQLASPDFFAPSNTQLVAFLRTLGRRGVLRIGGNTSEFTVWTPQASQSNSAAAVGPDVGLGSRIRQTSVTPEAVRNLASFANSAEWDLIYGLNLGHGNPEQAAAEAKAVSEAAGRRLLYFQIGNEPDLYRRNGLRPPNWGFEQYFTQWKQFAGAVRRSVPGARFGAPDVAADVQWITDFAQQGKGEIVELTGHYYAEGPPENPAMNIDRLLHPNQRLERDIPIIQSASRESGRPYRMTETNSCYHGGKPGVSDTFASALWGGDYWLQLAAAGFVGINFHGGGEGYYTPIAGGGSVGFVARPLYYGMLLAGQFAGAKMLKCALETKGVNATAYSADAAGATRLVAIFNKDSDRGLRVSLSTHKRARLWRLTAPGLDSKTNVTLAGAAVTSSGSWAPAHEEHLVPNRGTLKIDVPPASAVLAFL